MPSDGLELSRPAAAGRETSWLAGKAGSQGSAFLLCGPQAVRRQNL